MLALQSGEDIAFCLLFVEGFLFRDMMEDQTIMDLIQ